MRDDPPFEVESLSASKGVTGLSPGDQRTAFKAGIECTKTLRVGDSFASVVSADLLAN